MFTLIAHLEVVCCESYNIKEQGGHVDGHKGAEQAPAQRHPHAHKVLGLVNAPVLGG